MFCSFQSTHLHTSFVKFIPKYFSLLDIVVNGIIFLTSCLDCLLVVYRKAIDFIHPSCILGTLQNLFISSHCVYACVNSLGFSLCKIMSSVDRDKFAFSFQYRCHSFLFLA